MINDSESNAQRHVAMFLDDPLDTTINIPGPIFWAALADDCTCRASESMLHCDWCECVPIWARVCAELGIMPRRQVSLLSPLDWHWVCSDGDSWHTGGEINGPDHWCEREGRWMEDDYSHEH